LRSGACRWSVSRRLAASHDVVGDTPASWVGRLPASAGDGRVGCWDREVWGFYDPNLRVVDGLPQ
jgi:hypothetical protein